MNFFKTHSCDSSTGFGSLFGIVTLKRKLPSRFSLNIWIICVFQPLFTVIFLMCCFVSRGKLLFWFILYSSHLIRVVRKVEPSVKFISKNHYSSVTTIFSQNNLTSSLDVWCDFLLNSVSSKSMSNS